MKMLLKTKDFDIFGEPFVFTTNKNQYFKSYFGGVMSIISIFLILAISFTLSRDIFLRIEPRISIDSYPLSEIPFYNITNDNFFLAFRFESSMENIIDFKNYFIINLDVIKYNIHRDDWTYQTITQLTYNNCSKLIDKSTFDNSSLKAITLGYNCIDFTNLQKNNTKLGGHWVEHETMIYLSLSVNLCNKALNENCKSTKEAVKFLEDDIIYLTIINPGFKYSNLDNKISNPLKRSIQPQYLSLSPKQYLIASNLFYNITSYDDQSYLFEDYVKKDYLAFDNYRFEPRPQNEVVGNNLLDNYDVSLCEVNFYFSRNILIYKRSFMKLLELLSLIGGFMSITFSFVGFFCKYYNIFKRNIALMSDSFCFIDGEQNQVFNLSNSSIDNNDDEEVLNEINYYDY